METGSCLAMNNIECGAGYNLRRLGVAVDGIVGWVICCVLLVAYLGIRLLIQNLKYTPPEPDTNDTLITLAHTVQPKDY